MQITEKRDSLSLIKQQQKNYRIKNSDWHCQVCDIYCNSYAQFEVHLISQKHKLTEKNHFSVEDNSFSSSSQNDENKSNCDENNNQENKPKIDINNFSLAESHKINAHGYLIPDSKRVGKFEKFGFYCSKCNAYMTGQIQLVMHVKGAKHQFYSPGEIPGYIPSKVYNPSFRSAKFGQRHALPEPIGCSKSQLKKNSLPCSTPVKATQGSYAEYLIKNQSLMQNQYYARYYSNNYQTPVFNQFNQPYTSNSPPTPLSQNQPNGSYMSTYQTSPAHLVPSHSYQINQQFRIFPPSQSSLIVVKNESMDSKSSSYNSSNENCLNRSFEKNFAAYNNFDSPLFNVQQAQLYSNTIHNPSPQMFYQQKNSNGFFYNSPESNPTSTSPQVNLAYYQNYSIIS